MAQRLKTTGWAPPGPRRRGRFVALVLGVIAIHACVTRELADRMEGFASAARMPARIEVAYVRMLEPAAPPVAAPAPAPTPPPRPRVARVRPARAASAPASAAVAEVPKEAAAVAAQAAASEAARVAAEALAADAALAAADAAATPAPASASQALADAASAPDAKTVASAPATSERVAGAASQPVPSTAPGSASQEPFDWPASTRVSFDLTGSYRGEVNGNAQVEWIRVGTRYQVNLDLLVGPAFAPLITRRMSSEGDLTADGLMPSRYDEDTQAVFRERRRVSVVFEPDAVVLANGDRRERWRGVQDTASQFIQLTYLFTTRPELLRVGGAVEVPLALPRNVDRWIYDVIGEAVIQTPFGPLSTFHLKPRRVRKMTTELSAEIWFAPQLRYLPVRIRIEQDPRTYLDLVIARKPELASR